MTRTVIVSYEYESDYTEEDNTYYLLYRQNFSKPVSVQAELKIIE